MKKVFTPDLRRELTDLFKKWRSLGFDSDTKIAGKLGVHPLTIGRWRRFEVVPDDGNLKEFRGFVGGPSKQEPELAAAVPMVQIPMLGSLPAGSPHDAHEEKVGELELPAIMLGGNFKDCYAIELDGDCMEPEAYKGEWVVVRRNKEPRPGDWVVAKIDGELCVKTMGKKAGELIPINPKYKKLTAKHELQIFGVVIKVIADPARRRRV